MPTHTGGQYPSLLALLAAQHELVQELPQLFLAGTVARNGSAGGITSGAGTHPAQPPPVLLPAAVQQAARAWDKATGTSTPPPHAKEAAVVAALCAQFGVGTVEMLGCGPVQQLLEDWGSAEMYGGVVAACALACGVESGAPQAAGGALLGIGEMELVDAALAALTSAPELADLAEW